VTSVAAIVPAAGHSRRMGGRDKLRASLGGKPLLAWCVETLESSDLISRVVVAVAPGSMARYRRLSEQRGWRKSVLCEGGPRRQDSVASALSLCGDVELVLVHDGDRPFLTVSMIEAGVAVAATTGAAVAAVPVTDTVKVVRPDSLVDRTLDRSVLRAAQTPQVFRREWLEQAHASVNVDVTDDATLVERLGYPVKLYAGAGDNLKVTTPGDLRLARTFARLLERVS